MQIADVDRLSRYDALWFSPHVYDALLSGTGRLLRSRRQGLKTLLVTAFGDERSDEARVVFDRLGLDHLSLGLLAAHRRNRSYAAFTARVFATHPDDAELIETLRRSVEDLGHRTKARDVYAPLGVGGNVDHRLLHEAAGRAFPVGPGQNVFFFEDRPYALIPGAVRLRLGQLAVRLPPAITDVGDRAGLLRHVRALLSSPVAKASLKGLRERTRCLWLAAHAYRHAHAWHPRRAFGLRLQPLVDTLSAELVGEIRETLGILGDGTRRLIGSPALVGRANAAYARRLGFAGPVERYWLLLPPREAEGVTALSEASSAETLR
jgi:hypothetical protein